jgi:hypothetical protein
MIVAVAIQSQHATPDIFTPRKEETNSPAARLRTDSTRKDVDSTMVTADSLAVFLNLLTTA